MSGGICPFFIALRCAVCIAPFVLCRLHCAICIAPNAESLILQVSVAVFSVTMEKFFGQKCLSPLEKMAHTPMTRTAEEDVTTRILNFVCIRVYQYLVILCMHTAAL